jgi:hypothetical protein
MGCGRCRDTGAARALPPPHRVRSNQGRELAELRPLVGAHQSKGIRLAPIVIAPHAGRLLAMNPVPALISPMRQLGPKPTPFG